MNYAIFRSEPIMNTNDLAQIGSHNQREKKAYKSNPDIRIDDSYKNIQLVPLNYKYVKRFHELTKEYEKQHNEKMKTERKERRRTYTQMVNRSRNCVADELLFTASPKFFDNMSEVNNYAKSYSNLEKENNSMSREIKQLKNKNEELTNENQKLLMYIKYLFSQFKEFLRKLLLFGNEQTKDSTVTKIKWFYDTKDFNSKDVMIISKGTTKEDELFEYADLPDYLKERKHKKKDKDDFDMSL